MGKILRGGAALLLTACGLAGPVNTSPTLGVGKTSTATASATATATPKATETFTPTDTLAPSETPNLYTIDPVKLQTEPKSLADVEANPQNYQEAPDPLTDKPAFDAWFEQLKTDLGDPAKLKPNLITHFTVTEDSMIDIVVGGGALNNPPDFFFMRHNGDIYPVLVTTLVDSDGYGWGTYAMIIADSSQFDALMEGKKAGEIILYRQQKIAAGDAGNQLIAAGINTVTTSSPDQVQIAVARVGLTK